MDDRGLSIISINFKVENYETAPRRGIGPQCRGCEHGVTPIHHPKVSLWSRISHPL